MEVRTALQAPVSDWFWYRYLCTEDEDKFQLFFKRLVNQKARKFILLYEAQMKTIDPELTREYKYTKATTSTGGGTFSELGSHVTNTTGSGETNTESNSTDDSTTETGETANLDGSVSTSNNSGTDTASNGSSYNRILNSDTPQSMVASATTGNPSDISWNYATALQDTLNNNTSSETTTSSGSSSTTTDNTTTVTGDSSTHNIGSADVKTTDSTTGKVDGTTEKSGENTQNGTSSGTDEGTERNEPLQDLYKRYYSYVMNGNAFEYIIKELDKVFLSVYNVD